MSFVTFCCLVLFNHAIPNKTCTLQVFVFNGTFVIWYFSWSCIVGVHPQRDQFQSEFEVYTTPTCLQLHGLHQSWNLSDGTNK
ncbi:hypothetical protein PVAP13_4NG199311 [Panicum virgatum]|uniref:Secreted protein n=1 Tax=Panicum virgatum TaxID=38727 RepID=A0A8T0TEW9_PANVG|nr:hypothetical protein PVAP13_4NG199311 [Panicum virgatum]